MCATCAVKSQVMECNHNDFERSLYGTWCLVEVNAAVSYGYTIMEINEIWEYKTEQYSSQTKTGGLFTKFMKSFLKIKQESSGYPEGVITDTDKENYIHQFAEKNDILLDAEKIAVNPSYRSLSKLLVNSLCEYGKRFYILRSYF